MSNFNEDDPLADLLSDGSNDSFFEEPKVLAKKTSISKTPEKKPQPDLFNVGDKKEDWLGLNEQPKKKEEKTGVKSNLKSSKKISFENDDDDDIFTSMGLEKRTEKPVTETKKSLLDSILGKSDSSKTEKTEITNFQQEENKNKPQFTPKSPSKQADSIFGILDAPRESRRPRTQNPSIMDPLGLFSSGSAQANDEIASRLKNIEHKQKNETLLQKNKDDAKYKSSDNLSKEETVARGESDMGIRTDVLFTAQSKDLKTKSTPNLTDLPGWLSGEKTVMRQHKSDMEINNVGHEENERGKNVKIDGRKKVGYNQEEVYEKRAENAIGSGGNIKRENEGKLLDGNKEISEERQEIRYNLRAKEIDETERPLLETLLTQHKLATSHIEYQNTSMALQQQESQLLMALQLKKYEENLMELQKKQQEVLIKQEQQFNNLLERQFAKQQVMENNMRLQQERINNHIQMLLTQPQVAGDEMKEKVAELKKNNDDEIVKSYEGIIASLKQKHHEEVFLLEESYKKQISTLEEMSTSIESRLKIELENLTEVHNKKLEEMQKQHESEVEKYKAKIEEIREMHKNELRLVRENQNRTIDELKYEFSTLMENIKDGKNSERALFENADSYNQKLEFYLKMLDVNSKTLLDIKNQVENNSSSFVIAREESLKAKEEEIKLMRITLEKAREMADAERSQLMALIRSLETKLAEQSYNAREEKWALQQATATLTARTAALDREVEYTRTTLEQERSQLKTLKETFLAEQKQALLQITEEKLQLSAEKSRLETSAKLQNNFDNQRARAEIEAAVQAAKEAAEQAYKEQEMLRQQQYEIEALKRRLDERERKLFTKERNLESITKEAERKAAEGERALYEARSLEIAYNEKLRGIQNQINSLSNREKRLAEEKLAVSKERLALQSGIKLSKKCSLCNIETVNKSDEDLDGEVEQDIPQYINIPDPELMRLRYEIEEERRSSTNY